MNIFYILFAIETLLLFVGIVPVNTMSMVFYAVTMACSFLNWVDRDRKPKISKITVEDMEEILNGGNWDADT